MPLLATWQARVYLSCVVLAGAVAVIAAAVVGASAAPFAWAAVAALAALNLVASSWDTGQVNHRARSTLSSVVILSVFPLVGTYGAVLVASMAFIAQRRDPLVKRLFNGSQQILAVLAAGLAYTTLGGGIGVRTAQFLPFLGRMLAADVAFFVVNAVLVAFIVSMTQRLRLLAVLTGTMVPQAVPHLGYSLFGLLLAVLWDGVGIGPFAAVLVLMPLVVARWAYSQYVEQQVGYDRTIRSLVQAVETKDLYTRGHSERVAHASEMIAREIGMREDRVTSLRYAGILHDVGKLGVPTRVLQKSGRLTDEEYAAIKLHPVRGLEVVRDITFLGEAYVGIMHHHERIDGMGYPMGLRGEEIPEFARIIGVADAFDSMTTTRSYRGARSVSDAVDELRRCAGTQFDPELVESFIAALHEQGWEPETSPLFDVEPVDVVEGDAFDHDDPRAPILGRTAEEGEE